MKILHTSDWHLGQRFLLNDRSEEQQAALDRVLQIIREEQVDLLLLSGDVFDIGNPPFPARRIYYRFLRDLLGTCCRYVVITGGNHDAPGMLEAPKELLQGLNIFVVGAAPENPADMLLELRDDQDRLEAVVAAVPFLRDRDLKSSIAGESAADRVQHLRKALAAYFEALGEQAKAFEPAGVPILCTGHLYASGADASGKQDNIYIGDVENIQADAFPTIFSYVALGHIHRAQKIGGRERVRYSGSLIPLSFSETRDEKSVTLLEYEGASLQRIYERKIEGLRRLKTIEGSREEVKKALAAFAQRHADDPFRPWVEAIVHLDTVDPAIEEELYGYCKSLHLELLKLRIQQTHQPLQPETETESLSELERLDVFRRRCAGSVNDPEALQELEATFCELLEWMSEHHSPQPN